MATCFHKLNSTLRNVALRSLLLTFAAANLLAPADAAVITFFDFDRNPNDPQPPASHPNADAARAAFLAKLEPGTIGFQSFESQSATFGFPPLGVTATLSGPYTFGTGTHPGGLFAISGVSYVQSFAPLSAPRTFLTIDFSSPQQAFGFYGVDFADFIGFPDRDGSIQVVMQSGSTTTVKDVYEGISVSTLTSGSVHFWGIIDTEHPFTRVSLLAPPAANWAGEGISIDDLYVGTALAVPEPSTLALFATALFAAMARFGLRRSRAKPSVT